MHQQLKQLPDYGVYLIERHPDRIKVGLVENATQLSSLLWFEAYDEDGEAEFDEQAFEGAKEAIVEIIVDRVGKEKLAGLTVMMHAPGFENLLLDFTPHYP
jgi:hypothetical protein